MARTAAPHAFPSTSRAPFAFLLVPALFLIPALGLELAWSSADAAAVTQTLEAPAATGLQSTGLDLVLPATEGTAATPAPGTALELHTNGLDLTFAPGEAAAPQAGRSPVTRPAAVEPVSSGLDLWFTASGTQGAETPAQALPAAERQKPELGLQSSGADLWFGVTYAPLPESAPRQQASALGPQGDLLSSGQDVWFTVSGCQDAEAPAQALPAASREASDLDLESSGADLWFAPSAIPAATAPLQARARQAE